MILFLSNFWGSLQRRCTAVFFMRQKRTVRTLSQPKFSPDMKAKELLETIQSNAIKCFDYMKENNAIL